MQQFSEVLIKSGNPSPRTVAFVLCLLLACLASPLPALAQAPSETGTPLVLEELEDFLRRAERENVKILVIERNAPVAPAAPDGLSPAGAIDVAEQRILLIGRAAAADLAMLPARLQSHWPEGWSGLAKAVLLAVLACAVGWLVEVLVRRNVVRRRAADPDRPIGAAIRYPDLLRSVAADLLGLALQIAVAVAIVLAVTERGAPERHVGYALILIGCVVLRLGLALIDLFLRQPGVVRSGGEVIASGTASIRRKGVLLAVALAIGVSILTMINRLELGSGLFQASRLVVAIGFVGALAAVLWTERRPISAVAFQNSGSMAARAWPWIALAYLGGSLALFVAKVLSDTPVNGIAILGPIYCGAVAYVIYAICMALLLRRRAVTVTVPVALADPPPAADPAAPPALVVDGSAGPRIAPAPNDATAISAAVAVSAWAGGVALAWGVPLWSQESNSIYGFWAILLILLAARIAWIATRAFFDRLVAAERQNIGAHEPSDEGGGGKGSRLGTILPLVRSFLLITVSVIAAMIVLSQLGVDIAPIFAGAGLVGVAVGFGAQSLVRDIFSGLFFLIDDAFRVGEYIETGGLKGTVERISVRSMQLRHQNGPLHTIPFGEITQLTNFSRDWVIMKLPIRVTFNTDPERVRKLIKKIGQELMADPVIGPKFVEPLKSQGVREIDDSGQVLRVKFMTRPGEQFVLRKMVYARIREVFAHEGIEFAAREVRVRVTTQGEPLSEADTQKIAGAAAEGALNP